MAADARDGGCNSRKMRRLPRESIYTGKMYRKIPEMSFQRLILGRKVSIQENKAGRYHFFQKVVSFGLFFVYRYFSGAENIIAGHILELLTEKICIDTGCIAIGYEYFANISLHESDPHGRVLSPLRSEQGSSTFSSSALVTADSDTLLFFTGCPSIIFSSLRSAVRPISSKGG